MRRTSDLIWWAALFCIVATPVAAQPAGKVLRLGAGGGVLDAMEAGRSAGAADMTSDLEMDTPEKKRRAVGMVKERLDGYSLVTVHMQTAQENEQELQLVTEAAAELGIDMVFEGMEAMAMAELFGLGVGGTAVVVRTDPETRRQVIYSFDEDRSKSLEFTAEVSGESELTFPPLSEEQRKQAEKRAREKGPAPSDQTTRKPAPAAKAPQIAPPKMRYTKAEIAQEVDKALKEGLPQGRGRRFAAVAADLPPSHAFRSFTLVSSGEVALAENAFIRSRVSWDVNLLASKSPPDKRLQIFTSGAGASVDRVVRDTPLARYYFLKEWQTTMSPEPDHPSAEGFPPSFIVPVEVRDWQPRTANRQKVVSYTSGWEITVGASPDGPEVGGTYSQSKTHMVETRDFELRASLVGPIFRTHRSRAPVAVRHTFTGPDFRSLLEAPDSPCHDPVLEEVPDSAWDPFSPEVYAEYHTNSSESFGMTFFALIGRATYGRAEIYDVEYSFGCARNAQMRDDSYSVLSGRPFVVAWHAVDPGE